MPGWTQFQTPMWHYGQMPKSSRFKPQANVGEHLMGNQASFSYYDNPHHPGINPQVITVTPDSQHGENNFRGTDRVTGTTSNYRPGINTSDGSGDTNSAWTKIGTVASCLGGGLIGCVTWQIVKDTLAKYLGEWWTCFITALPELFKGNWKYFESDQFKNCETGFIIFSVLTLAVTAFVLVAVFGVTYFAGSSLIDVAYLVWDILHSFFGVLYGWVGWGITTVWNLSFRAVELGLEVVNWLAKITHSHPILWAINLATALLWGVVEVITEYIQASLWFKSSTSYRIYRALTWVQREILELISRIPGGRLLGTIISAAMLPLSATEFLVSIILGGAYDGLRSVFSNVTRRTEPNL